MQREGPALGLLEREVELARVRAALEDARARAGRLVVVEAPAGVGKTALLRQVRTEAAAAGLEVLRARGSPVEHDFPFGVVRQLLRRSLKPGAVRNRQGTGLLDDEQQTTLGWEPGSALLHKLYWLLADKADEQPVLLLVDDAHWADRASLDFLRFLSARLDDVAIAVVLALRPAEGESAGSLVWHLELDPLADVLYLQPLSAGAVGQLVEAALGAADPKFVAGCHAATAGNPFFVQELVRSLRELGVEPRREHVGRLETVGPARVGRWVLGRLERLPLDALAIARAVAVLGDDAELRHVAQLAEVGERTAAAVAGELTRAAIFRDGRPLAFAHPIVRRAVYGTLSQAELAAAHGDAADLLAREAAPVERVAAHLLRAEPRSDGARVSVLLRAAELALARGVPAAAVTYGRRALDEPPSPQSRAVVLRALGEAELRGGDARSAEGRLRDALIDARTPAESGQTAVALVSSLRLQFRFEEAADLLEHVLAEVDPRDPVALELEAALGNFATLVPGRVADARRRLERYAGLRGDTPVERSLLASLARARSALGGSADDCVPLARRALGGARLFGPDGLDYLSWATAVAALMSADEDVEAVRRALQTGIEDARSHSAPFEFMFAAERAAAVAGFLGDLREGEAWARLAVQVAHDQGWQDLYPFAGAQLMRILALRGEVGEAEEILRGAGMDGPIPETMVGNIPVYCRAELRLVQGRLDEAIADLRQVGRVEQAYGLRAPGAPWRSQLAVALVGQDPVAAVRLADEELELARAWGRPCAVGFALRGCGIVQGGDRGIELLREAVEVLERSSFRHRHAVALVDLGAALRRAGLRREAREQLERGAELALRCGGMPVARAAAEELKAAGGRRRSLLLTGAEALTPMERRIASMAAEGQSNPEIARALFVTRKNVEMHLSRAYSKLDIRSRAELAGALALERTPDHSAT